MAAVLAQQSALTNAALITLGGLGFVVILLWLWMAFDETVSRSGLQRPGSSGKAR